MTHTVFISQFRLQTSFFLFETEDTARHTETSDPDRAIRLIEASSSKSIRAINNLSLLSVQVITAEQQSDLKLTEAL